MASIDELPLSTSAYLADTGHLTTLEHGAYLLLLIAMRRSSTGWLPASDQYLARATRMTLGRWKKIAATIRPMLVTEGDQVSQKRILRERQESKSAFSRNPNSKANPLKNIETDSDCGEAPSLLVTSSNKDSEVKEESKGAAFAKVGSGGRYRKTGKRSRMSAEWKPSEHGELYAAGKGFTPQRIEEMARGCLLYHRKHGTLIADYEATWEGWVDREVIFDRNRPKRKEPVGPSMFDIATNKFNGSTT